MKNGHADQIITIRVPRGRKIASSTDAAEVWRLQPPPHLADGDNPHGRVLDGLGNADARPVQDDELVQPVALDDLEAAFARLQAEADALPIQ